MGRRLFASPPSGAESSMSEGVLVEHNDGTPVAAAVAVIPQADATFRSSSADRQRRTPTAASRP
jgi:hypothetical protein